MTALKGQKFKYFKTFWKCMYPGQPTCKSITHEVKIHACWSLQTTTKITLIPVTAFSHWHLSTYSCSYRLYNSSLRQIICTDRCNRLTTVNTSSQVWQYLHVIWLWLIWEKTLLHGLLWLLVKGGSSLMRLHPEINTIWSWQSHTYYLYMKDNMVLFYHPLESTEELYNFLNVTSSIKKRLEWCISVIIQ